MKEVSRFPPEIVQASEAVTVHTERPARIDFRNRVYVSKSLPTNEGDTVLSTSKTRTAQTTAIVVDERGREHNEIDLTIRAQPSRGK